jgi:predicted nucleotide-binding protein (sugar kinase/HSP70/actin superfamily)
MESDLVSYHQKGVEETDLIAGLCYAIANNYLNRVVGKRKIGQRVMFLGGPSLNKAVVAAFENILGRGLLVPRHREVLGAYGAAISVQEMMRREGADESRFRGLASAIADRMTYKEKTCRADAKCQNQCKLKVYDFDGRRSVWGGECGRYEATAARGVRKQDFFESRQKVWRSYLAGVCEELRNEPLLEVDGRPTVGMQSSLYGQQTAVLWAHFFEKLGFRLVLTPPTNGHISKAGIEAMVAETCYPVKVSHGHVKELGDKTKHLFLPSVITMSTPEPSETGFLCPMVQSNSYMVRAALGLDPARVWSPVVRLKRDPAALAIEISEQLADRLGSTRAEIRAALDHALERQHAFEAQLHEMGRAIVENRGLDEPVVVVTGRPYNLYDERLNLRLGRNLAKIGVTALPMDFIDVSSVDLSDFPSMYWGLGAQILRTAKFVEKRPGWFGLHLTNFACGADSFVEHFYKHIMGEKPYLILEVDEHSAVAGVMTRLEAYRNVIENAIRKTVRPHPSNGEADVQPRRGL